MTLAYYPEAGEILLCNYGTGFVAPEVVKLRPVVVVSPRLRRRADLVAVVPLSTTPPNPAESHHCSITLRVPLPRPYEAPHMWAKCDMLATVALARLDRFRDGRVVGGGKRRFTTGRVDAVDLVEIRKAILHGLGLGDCHFNGAAGLASAITSLRGRRFGKPCRKGGAFPLRACLKSLTAPS